MTTPLKPGDVALLVLTVPRLRLMAVRVSRVWVSLAGTTRVEVDALAHDGRRVTRQGACFDRRQLIGLDNLESELRCLASVEKLSAAAPKDAAQITVPAGAAAEL